MSHKMKRIIAVMLAVLICLSNLVVVNVFAGSTSLIIEDSFSDSSFKKWKDSVGKIKNGQYFLGDNAVNVLDTTEKEKVVISADVTVEYSKTANQMASVFVCADKNASKAYEFGIGIAKSGVPFARLYLKGDKDTEQILYQLTENIPGTAHGKIEEGVTYNIQVGVKDKEIRCLINGVLVCSIEDATYQKGYAGIRSTGKTSVFDNVSLKEIGKREVEGIKLINPPETAALYSLLEFDIEVSRGDFYGTETISSTDPDVVISGIGNTAGKKTAKVTIGGKSAEFDITVSEKFESVNLFTQLFSDSQSAQQNLPVSKPHDKINYYWEFSDNKLFARYPTSVGDFNSVAQLSATLQSTISQKWPEEPYEVVLNTAIHTKAITVTKRTAFTGITFAKDNSTGGEYLITIDENGLVTVSCTDTGRVLQKNNINLYNKDLQVTLGKEFELKVQVTDSVMKAFYNGELVSVVPLSLDDANPAVRIRSGNGTVSFSKLAVNTLQTRDPDYAKKIVLKKVNDRKVVEKVTGAKLDLGFYFIEVTYPDGVVDHIVPTEDMLLGYEEGKSSKITVKCGDAKTNFQFEYVNALFVDRFEDSIHPGWTRSNSTWFTQQAKNGVLDSTFNYSGTLASDYFTVTNGSDWTDYTVSTEFAFARDTRLNSYVSQFNLIFRYQNSKNYCMFTIKQQGNSLSGTLTMYKDSITGALTVATFKTARLNMCLEQTKSLSTGETYKVAVSCVGNTFFIYFEDILIYTYTDETEDALMYGTAGIRYQNFSGVTDNFMVTDELGSGFESITISGVEDNTFEIYEGGTIETDGVIASLNNRNGGKIDLLLKQEMISDYDNMKVGTQNIKIKTPVYDGNAKVKVMERHDYINELNAELESLKTDKITAADKKKIEELQDNYDVLTAYEVSLLDEKAVENLKKAGIALDGVLYAGVSKVDNFVYETMDKDTVWEEDASTRSVGYINYRNGYLAQSLKAYNLWGSSYSLYPAYGKAVAVSSDMMKIDDAYSCAVMLNRNKDGFYYLRFSDDTDDGTHKIQIRRLQGNVGTIVASAVIENFGLECKKGEWFNITLTYIDGILHGFYNGVEIVSYDDTINSIHFETGYSGYYNGGSDFRMDNFRVYGTAMEEPEEAYVEPVVYTDNFEDETVGIRPSHWIEPATFEEGMSENYKVYSLFGSKVYGTQNTAENTMSYLHAFDKNTVWESDFYVGNSSSASIIGFVFKLAPETTYVKVGYSFGEKRWFLYEEKDDGSEAWKTYSEKTYNLASNTKHTVKIQFDDKKFSLIVNGEEVIKYDNVVCDGYGRMGMYTEKVQMYVDNVNITLNSGILPNDGVLEFVFGEPAIGYSATQVIDMGDGLMIAVVNKGKHAYRSRDWGETWEDITLTDGVELLSIQCGYPEIIKLSNGKYLSVRSASYEVYVSDNMLDWELLTQVKMPYKYDELGRKYVDENNRENSMHHINSLLEFTMLDGTNRILLAIGVNGFADDITQTRGSGNMKTMTFYSDDYGKTWTQSDNDTTAVDLGYVDENNLGQWGESKFLLCPDGVIRMYNTRSYSPYVVYTESKDYGKSWSGMYVIPEIQIPVASITIEEDPYEKGTFYMAWVNNAPQTYGSGGPRIRLSLARSTDGVNWKYLTDLERMVVRFDVDRENTTQLYQVIDPSMTITKDHIYVNYGRSQSAGDVSQTAMSVAHGQVGRRYTKIVKANLSEKEWDASNIADVSLPKSIEIAEMPNLKFGVGDVFALSDGKVKVTALDGSTSTREFSEFMVREAPNMYKKGKQSILLYDRNFMQLNLDVEIVEKYKVKWDIIGDGEIEPKKTSVLDGEDYTFKLSSAGKVYVNGEKLRGKNRTFTVKDIHEDLEITVEFSEGIFASVGVIAGISAAALVVIAGAVFAVIWLVKKKKVKN